MRQVVVELKARPTPHPALSIENLESSGIKYFTCFPNGKEKVSTSALIPFRDISVSLSTFYCMQLELKLYAYLLVTFK